MKNLILGSHIKQLRKEKALSQNDVAQELKFSLRGYQDLESGKCGTTIERLINIADYFGVSVDYLIGHETQSIIHLDSLTPLQQKIMNMVKTLNDDQSAQVISICSYVLGVPYDKVKPERPW